MLTVVVFYTSTKITTIECDAAFTAMAPMLTAHSVILNTLEFSTSRLMSIKKTMEFEWYCDEAIFWHIFDQKNCTTSLFRRNSQVLAMNN